MKHLHFDAEADGFYGAYRAFPAAGKYSEECRRIGIDIEKRDVPGTFRMEGREIRCA